MNIFTDFYKNGDHLKTFETFWTLVRIIRYLFWYKKKALVQWFSGKYQLFLRQLKRLAVWLAITLISK